MGPLLIVGGADKIFQTDIYEAFLDNCLNPEGIPLIAVLATASSDPEGAFESIRKKMTHAGSCRPELVPVSIHKKEWLNGAFDESVLSLIRRCDGIWFTGGDQNFTLAALKEEDGTDTPLLREIRKKNEEGALIGGTSAGAAVMTNPMIGGGNTAEALFSLLGEELPEGDVVLAGGLGFLSGYLVDQHFDMRSRMGRLIAALCKSGQKTGLGISENSALLLKNDRFSVYGSGPVYLINLNDLCIDENGARGIEISFFEKGDIFHPVSGDYDVGNKAYIGSGGVLSSLRPSASGVFSPYADLRNFLARQLMDNDESLLMKDDERASLYISSYLFDPSLFPGKSPSPALELRFHKKKEISRAYADAKGGFSVVGIELEIIKRHIEIS